MFAIFVFSHQFLLKHYKLRRIQDETPKIIFFMGMGVKSHFAKLFWGLSRGWGSGEITVLEKFDKSLPSKIENLKHLYFAGVQHSYLPLVKTSIPLDILQSSRFSSMRIFSIQNFRFHIQNFIKKIIEAPWSFSRLLFFEK